MVQRVITELFDDLDGSPAVETVRYGYAGHSYEIDLNDEHAPSWTSSWLATSSTPAGLTRRSRRDRDEPVKPRRSIEARRSFERSGSGLESRG